MSLVWLYGSREDSSLVEDMRSNLAAEFPDIKIGKLSIGVAEVGTINTSFNSPLKIYQRVPTLNIQPMDVRDILNFTLKQNLTMRISNG